MISERDPPGLEHNERPLGRSEMEVYGIYEISKILCGPGCLEEILRYYVATATTTMLL